MFSAKRASAEQPDAEAPKNETLGSAEELVVEGDMQTDGATAGGTGMEEAGDGEEQHD